MPPSVLTRIALLRSSSSASLASAHHHLHLTSAHPRPHPTLLPFPLSAPHSLASTSHEPRRPSSAASRSSAQPRSHRTPPSASFASQPPLSLSLLRYCRC
eukprot:2232648-Rhodomonas_salina.1